MIWIKVKRWFMLAFICKFKGHNHSYEYHHNGYKKGTFGTRKPIPLYQKKCNRCNRFYGKKIGND